MIGDKEPTSTELAWAEKYLLDTHYIVSAVKENLYLVRDDDSKIFFSVEGTYNKVVYNVAVQIKKVKDLIAEEA